MVARAACALDDFKAYCALKKRAEERETWALLSTAPSGKTAEKQAAKNKQPALLRKEPKSGKPGRCRVQRLQARPRRSRQRRISSLRS